MEFRHPWEIVLARQLCLRVRSVAHQYCASYVLRQRKGRAAAVEHTKLAEPLRIVDWVTYGKHWFLCRACHIYSGNRNHTPLVAETRPPLRRVTTYKTM